MVTKVLNFIAVLLALGLLVYFYVDTREREIDSLNARLELMEQKIRERTRPVINIQRATVYNTDGEIVIQDIARQKEKL